MLPIDKTSEIRPGQRVLFGNRYSTQRHGHNVNDTQFEIASVISCDRDALILHSEDGQDHILKTPPYSSMRLEEKTNKTLLWTLPLPDGSDAAVRNFCQVALDAEYRMQMAHITSIEDGVIMGKLLIAGYKPFTPELSDDNASSLDFDFIGTLAISKREYRLDLTSRGKKILMRSQGYTPSSGTPVPGTLIAARDVSFWVDEGNEICEMLDWERIAEFSDLNAISSFLPKPTDGISDMFHSNDGCFGSISALEHELLRGHLACEPDEALALVYDSGDVVFLGQRGVLLFDWDSAADYFHDQAPGPGLYLVNDMKPWSSRSYEGEYDAGIDASMTPARLEDIERFGYDLPLLDNEIHEHLNDLDLQIEGLSLRQIALAEASLATENNKLHKP